MRFFAIAPASTPTCSQGSSRHKLILQQRDLNASAPFLPLSIRGVLGNLRVFKIHLFILHWLWCPTCFVAVFFIYTVMLKIILLPLASEERFLPLISIAVSCVLKEGRFPKQKKKLYFESNIYVWTCTVSPKIKTMRTYPFFPQFLF